MELEVNRGNQEPLRWNQEVNPGYQVPSPANHGTTPREEVNVGNQEPLPGNYGTKSGQPGTKRRQPGTKTMQSGISREPGSEPGQ